MNVKSVKDCTRMDEIAGDVKSIILNVFRAFIEICSNNNLLYYCSAGTALGAIRHKGFIPWDDDIDVVMFRRDYERFIEIFGLSNNETLELVEIHHSKHYHLPYAKLCDKRTTILERRYGKCVYGLNMDIFPLDGIITDKLKAKELYDRYKRLSNHLIDVENYWDIHEYRRQFRGRRYLRIIKMLCISLVRTILKKHIVKSIDNLVQSSGVDDTENVINFVEYYGFEKAIFPRLWFGEGRMVKFEDIYVRIPIECEKYLNRMYGDFMKLPPYEKRQTHHKTAYINIRIREKYEDIIQVLEK